MTRSDLLKRILIVLLCLPPSPLSYAGLFDEDLNPAIRNQLISLTRDTEVGYALTLNAGGLFHVILYDRPFENGSMRISGRGTGTSPQANDDIANRRAIIGSTVRRALEAVWTNPSLAILEISQAGPEHATYDNEYARFAQIVTIETPSLSGFSRFEVFFLSAGVPRNNPEGVPAQATFSLIGSGQSYSPDREDAIHQVISASTPLNASSPRNATEPTLSINSPDNYHLFEGTPTSGEAIDLIYQASLYENEQAAITSLEPIQLPDDAEIYRSASLFERFFRTASSSSPFILPSSDDLSRSRSVNFIHSLFDRK